MKKVCFLLAAVWLCQISYGQEIGTQLVGHKDFPYLPDITGFVGYFDDDNQHDIATVTTDEESFQLMIHPRTPLINYFASRSFSRLLDTTIDEKFIHPKVDNIFTSEIDQLFYIYDYNVVCILFNPIITFHPPSSQFVKIKTPIDFLENQKIVDFVFGNFYSDSFDEIVLATITDDESQIYICTNYSVSSEKITPAYSFSIPKIVSKLYKITFPDESHNDALFFQSVEGWHVLFTKADEFNHVTLDPNDPDYAYFATPPEDVIRPVDVLMVGNKMLVSVETSADSDISYLTFDLSDPNSFADYQINSLPTKRDYSTRTHLAKYNNKIVMIVGDKSIEEAYNNNAYLLYAIKSDLMGFTLIDIFTPQPEDFRAAWLTEFSGFGYIDDDGQLDYIFTGQVEKETSAGNIVRSSAFMVFPGYDNPTLPSTETSISDFKLYDEVH